jgi:hypothetical protein
MRKDSTMTRRDTRYRPLNINPKVDHQKSRPLYNADLLLGDVHAMLFLPRKEIGALRSGCNYAMLVTLCCVLGGVSRTIYPRRLVAPDRDSDRACFMKLFERIPWGTTKQGWISRKTAAALLYDGFRNPLVHELGTDEGGKPNKKPLPHEKYVVGKRGKVPGQLTLTEVLSREEWEPKWAVMYYRRRRKKVKISLVGLYFLTRKLIEQLTRDEDLIKAKVFPVRS